MDNAIALIQEPRIIRNMASGLKDANGVVFANAGSSKLRTCIFISKSINAILLPQFSGGDLTAVLIEVKMDGKSQKMVVASLYLPYDPYVMPPSEEMRKLIEFSEDSSLDLILGTDANSHNIVWGSSDTNPRGEALLEYLASTKLEILNIGDEPTFVTSVRKEVIDITLGTPNISKFINNWRVSDEPSMSDHRMLTFTLSANSSGILPYRNPKKNRLGAFLRNH